MYEELDSLKRNKTWKLVELPKGCQTIRNKWIYRVKTKPNGNVDRYKARLIVKGCSQRLSVDFSETFSSNMLRFNTVANSACNSKELRDGAV